MSAAPPSVSGIPGTGPAAKIEAWGGFAINEITSTIYSAANGGHTDWGGNEVNLIALDVASPGWIEDLASTPPASIIDTNDRYLDGRPTSRHGQYSPWFDNHAGASRVLLFGGGARYSTAATTVVQATDAYDTATRTWSALATMTGQLAGFENPAICRDQRNGDVYVAGSPSQWVMQKWTKATNSWSEVRSAATTELSFAAVRSAAAWDSLRNRIFIVGGSNACHHVYSPDSNTDASITLTGAAAAAVTGLFDAGLVYIPIGDFFIARDGGATGGTFYKITPGGVCTVFATSGGGSVPGTVANQLYNRMAYLPALQSIVWFPTYTGNGWVMRVELGPPPTITSQPLSKNVGVGSSATFSVVADIATGFQWQDNRTGAWSNVASGLGGTTSSYTTAATDSTFQGRKYRVIVTNAGGSTTSVDVALGVVGFPLYFWDTSVQSGADVWLRDPAPLAPVGLAADATAAATTVAALQLLVGLAAAASAQATASGDMGHGVPLTATATAAAAVSGALSLATPLAAAAVGQASATAALNLAMQLAVAAAASAGATGALAITVQLSGAASGVAGATGTLAGGSTVNLAGDAAAQAAASAALAKVVSLAGAATAQAAAAGALLLTISLAGAAIAQAASTGDLAKASALNAAAVASATGTGQIALSIALSGAALATATAQGAFTGVVTLGGSAAAAAGASGTLFLSVPLSAAAIALATTTAALNDGKPLGANAQASSVATGGLVLTVLLGGAAQAAALASGALTVNTQVQLTGAAGGQAITTGDLYVAAPIFLSAHALRARQVPRRFAGVRAPRRFVAHNAPRFN
jgi:hypothetical protein